LLLSFLPFLLPLQVAKLQAEAEKLIGDARAAAQKQVADAKAVVAAECAKELAEAKAVSTLPCRCSPCFFCHWVCCVVALLKSRDEPESPAALRFGCS